MKEKERLVAMEAFKQHDYQHFTKASDAVRIACPGRYGERLAIHKEHDAFTLYIRAGGREQVAEAFPRLQRLVSFRLVSTHDAIAIRGLSQDQLRKALSELVNALPTALRHTQ